MAKQQPKRDQEEEFSTGEKSASGWAIMDRAWERMQQKVFTNWVNAQLKKKKHDAVKDIVQDMETGIPLMKLMNSLYDAAVPKHNKNPRMRVHKLDNISQALETTEQHVHLHFVKPDLADNDTKMILGMIWTIIHSYQVADISVEELTAKEGLLLWCQRKTASYKTPPRDVNVKNFTDSWTDGLAFCALIHKHRPDLIDYDSLDKANAKENLALAFRVAEDELDIPALLDPEDMVDSVPDERSVITYVSEYFHKFSSSDKLETAGERIGRVIDLSQQNAQLRSDFDQRAKALAEWTHAKTDAMNERDFPEDTEAIKGLLRDLAKHKSEDKPPQAKEKADVEGLFNQLQTSLALNKRPPYEPPAGLSPKDLNISWASLGQAEDDRARALRELLRRREESDILLKRWRSRTKKFSLRCQLLDEDAQEIVAEAEAGSTLEIVENCEAQFATVRKEQGEVAAQLQGLQELAAQIHALGLKENTYTEATLESVGQEWAASQAKVDERNGQLNAEIEAEKSREALRVEFAQLADASWDWVHAKAEAINTTDAADADAIDAAIASLQGHQGDIAAYEAEFAKLTEVNGRVEAAQIFENQHTTHSYEEILAVWHSLPELARRKVNLLSNQKLALAGTQVTPEQLDDFSSTFQHFDNDKDGALNNYELVACLSALGEAVTEAEADAIIKDAGKATPGVLTFDEFVPFMVARTTHTDTPDQIKSAFAALAGDKGFITEAEMAPFLSPEQLAYCLANMPAVEGGYDYTAFTDSLYA